MAREDMVRLTLVKSKFHNGKNIGNFELLLPENARMNWIIGSVFIPDGTVIDHQSMTDAQAGKVFAQNGWYLLRLRGKRETQGLLYADVVFDPDNLIGEGRVKIVEMR